MLVSGYYADKFKQNVCVCREKKKKTGRSRDTAAVRLATDNPRAASGAEAVDSRAEVSSAVSCELNLLQRTAVHVMHTQWPAGCCVPSWGQANS